MSENQSSKIGVVMATIIGMSAMIGAGIFTQPSILAQLVGPAGIVTLTIVACSVWFLAQSFARVAQLFPQEGSFYIYASQWGGHSAGIIASGLYLFGLTVGMGLLAQLAGNYLTHYFSYFSSYSLGLVVLLILIGLNLIGTVLSKVGQQILIACTIFPILATTIICLSKASFANLIPFAPNGFNAIIDATRIVVFAFFGFEACASLFPILQNPEKNLPRAITASVICVALLYITFISSLMLAIPRELFLQYPGQPITAPLSILFPTKQWLIESIHFASLTALLGCLNSMIWSLSTLLLSFVKKFKNNYTRYAIQAGVFNQKTAIIIIGSIIFISFSILSSDAFFNITALFILCAYCMSLLTLFTIKNEWKSGRNYITLVGIIAACIMTYFAIHNIINSL